MTQDTDDLGLLARAFNAMLVRIEKREVELRCEIEERKRIELKRYRQAQFDRVTGLHHSCSAVFRGRA